MGLRETLAVWLWRAFLFTAGVAVEILVIVMLFSLIPTHNGPGLPAVDIFLLLNPLVYLFAILFCDGIFLLYYAAAYDALNYKAKAALGIRYNHHRPLLFLNNNELPGDFYSVSKVTIVDSVKYVARGLALWTCLGIVGAIMAILMVGTMQAFHVEL